MSMNRRNPVSLPGLNRRSRSGWLILWFFLLMAPIPVSANLVLPPLVGLILAPGPSTLMLFPAIITAPLLLIIAALEAFIAFRVTQTFSFKIWFLILLGANFISTIPGVFFFGISPSELWMVFLLLLAGSILIESVFCIVATQMAARDIYLGINAAVWMNLASYSLIGVLLLALTFGPRASFRENLALEEVPGSIILMDYSGNARMVLPSYESFDVVTAGIPPAEGYKVAHIGDERLVTKLGTGEVRAVVPKELYGVCEGWHVTNDGKYVAAVTGTKKSMGFSLRDIIVIDIDDGSYYKLPVQGDYAFSNDATRIAVASNKQAYIFEIPDYSYTTIPLPGHKDGLEWSPDNRYLAYIANTAPFYEYIGYGGNYQSLRVIRIEDKYQRTIASIDGSYYFIDWLSFVPDLPDQTTETARHTENRVVNPPE